MIRLWKKIPFPIKAAMFGALLPFMAIVLVLLMAALMHFIVSGGHWWILIVMLSVAFGFWFWVLATIFD